MKTMHNIEKLQGRSDYTGYGAGVVWRIRSTGTGTGWTASPAQGVDPNKADRAPTLNARTLSDISVRLSHLPIIT